MNFIEEENNQTMSARNKFPSYPSTATTTADLSLGLSSSSEETLVEKEHMFDKVVTPSDVGKLNRLVIPKQHAERYFPLDSTANEKGLLLNFEDPNGKPWRFRYSYWNSSQSYVMTKGWSRFVKDKKLDAGDVVSFHRGLGQGKDRLFIDHRRRRETGSPDFHNRRGERPYPPLGGYFSFDNYRSYPYHHHQQQQQWSYKTLGPSRDHGLYWHNNYQHRHQYHQPWHGYGGSSCNNNNNNNSNSPGGSGPWARIDPLPTNLNTIIPSEQAFSSSHLTYLRSPAIQATHEPVYESVPIVVKGTNKSEKKKRLRLFGVNMEESGEELRVVSSSSSRFVNKGKSSSFDLDI